MIIWMLYLLVEMREELHLGNAFCRQRRHAPPNGADFAPGRSVLTGFSDEHIDGRPHWRTLGRFVNASRNSNHAVRLCPVLVACEIVSVTSRQTDKQEVRHVKQVRGPCVS